MSLKAQIIDALQEGETRLALGIKLIQAKIGAGYNELTAAMSELERDGHIAFDLVAGTYSATAAGVKAAASSKIATAIVASSASTAASIAAAIANSATKIAEPATAEAVYATAPAGLSPAHQAAVDAFKAKLNAPPAVAAEVADNSVATFLAALREMAGADALALGVAMLDGAAQWASEHPDHAGVAGDLITSAKALHEVRAAILR